MEKPTNILSAEHQNILKVIDALLKEGDQLQATKKIDQNFFTKAIDFIRSYADKFHHAKEEEILFKEMCKDSVSLHCNPIEQMLHEHDLGRNYVKSLEEGLKQNDQAKVLEGARGYAYLLRDHIFKEDNILYPMADQVLPAEVQKSMQERFQKVEMEKLDSKTKEKYLAIIKEFESRT